MSYSIIVYYRRSSLFVYKQLVTCTHFGVIINYVIFMILLSTRTLLVFRRTSKDVPICLQLLLRNCV